ncbi:MAG: aminotransferase class V-fold PLP-dependent enzyme [Pseudomonadota bacterium]
MTSTPRIYLNACSLGLPDASCGEAIARQALRPPDRPEDESTLREAARRNCARLLRTDPEGVGLGTGTFQLWSTVMGRLPLRGGRILVAAHEWGDHVRWLHRVAAQTDTTVEAVPATPDGVLDPAAWTARMDDDVIALCLPLVTSLSGLRYPAEEIARLPRPDGALVVLDVAQALGRAVVTPEALGCDVLVGTARKWLRGPRQTALFWLSERARSVLQCTPGDIEPFDLNAALLAGLSQAVETALKRGLSDIADELEALEARLRSGLDGAEVVRLGPASTVGTIPLAVPLDRRPVIDARLRTRGIVAKWCDPRRDEPLSGAPAPSAHLRLSPHVYNTDADIEAALGALGSDVAPARKGA